MPLRLIARTTSQRVADKSQKSFSNLSQQKCLLFREATPDHTDKARIVILSNYLIIFSIASINLYIILFILLLSISPPMKYNLFERRNFILITSSYNNAWPNTGNRLIFADQLPLNILQGVFRVICKFSFQYLLTLPNNLYKKVK